MCSSDLCKYPERVLVADDPPAVCAVRGQRIARPADCAEVMMTLNVLVGAAAIEYPKESPRTYRGSQPPLEKPQNHADIPGPFGTALRATIERLGMPLEVTGDPEQAWAQLEEFRKTVVREAEEVART